MNRDSASRLFVLVAVIALAALGPASLRAQGCSVDLAEEYPGVPLDAFDLRAVAVPTGAVAHAGPTFNSRRVRTLPWGSSVQVASRVALPAGANPPSQIWYGFEEGGATLWIAARLRDRFYVEGVDAASDPCSGTPAPATLTFPYDRRAAAAYAIAHAYQNETLDSQPNRVTQRIPDNPLPYAEFKYTSINSSSGGTGSSAFLAEAIWMGGMPMTLQTAGKPCTDDLNDAATGWRYCGRNRVNADPSEPWDNHSAQITYYTTGHTPAHSGYTNNVLPDSSKGFKIGPPESELATLPSGLATDPEGDNYVAPGSPENIQSYFHLGLDDNRDGIHDPATHLPLGTFFNTIVRPRLAAVQQGDYMWADSYDPAVAGTDYHGFLVVGWGPAYDCGDALSRRLGLADLSGSLPITADVDPDLQDPTALRVPYVADYPGVGANAVQRPHPRPFYCSQHFDTETSAGYFANDHHWFFFHWPDAVTIPTELLFLPADWAWNPAGSTDVALIIDRSGSMAWNDPEDRRLTAARAYLRASLDGDAVGVVAFNGSASTVAQLTPLPEGKTTLDPLIDAIRPSGGTNIGAGVRQACTLLGAPRPGRGTAAILLTDGVGSFVPEDATCFVDGGWPIHTFGFGEADAVQLQGIANLTGGQYSAVPDLNQMICQFQQVRARIAGLEPTPCELWQVFLGQTIAFILTLPPDQALASFTTSWAGSDIVMSLTTPSGRVIDRGTVAPDVVHENGATFEVYSLRDPLPGEWTVTLFGADLPPAGEELAFGFTTLPMTGTVSGIRDLGGLTAAVDEACAQGQISRQGICRSLDAKLDAAQAALDRNQPRTARQQLEAFLAEVRAQCGKAIVEPACQRLQEGALTVLQGLS